MENSPAVSTGEWITIGIALATLFVTAVGVVLAYRLLRSPRTVMHISEWYVLRNPAQSSVIVGYTIEFLGVSGFRIIELGCKLFIGGLQIRLMKRQFAFGGREIELEPDSQAREDIDSSGPFAGNWKRSYAWPSRTAVDIEDDTRGVAEMWIRLTDGSAIRRKCFFTGLQVFGRAESPPESTS